MLLFTNLISKNIRQSYRSVGKLEKPSLLCTKTTLFSVGVTEYLATWDLRWTIFGGGFRRMERRIGKGTPLHHMLVSSGFSYPCLNHCTICETRYPILIEVEERLPEWQRQRREFFIEKCEYARLGLCLSFQIALELQALLDRQGNST